MDHLADIDNPLRYRSPEQLKGDVHAFAERHGLQHIEDLLLKGARVAQDPDVYESVEGLTPREKDALKREPKSKFWNQTKELLVTLLTCCIAAINQGWGEVGSNGANIGWPITFNLPGLISNYNPSNSSKPSKPSNPSNHELWIFGSVNAIPYFTASFGGAWLSDPLSEFFYGRRAAILIAAIFCFSSVIGSGFATSWKQLLACRALLGIGFGAKASVVPIFAAESAPAHIRGTIVMAWQVFVAFGVFLGFSANLIVAKILGSVSANLQRFIVNQVQDSVSTETLQAISTRINRSDSPWRVQLASAFIPALLLMVLVFLCPESPRFLIKKGRYEKAYTSLCYLRETPLQAARDLYYIDAQIQAETKLWRKVRIIEDIELVSNRHGKPMARLPVEAAGYWRRCWQLFSVPRIRFASISAFIVMISQQLCGINVLVFFSSTLYKDALDVDLNSLKPLWLSWGIGLANFLFAWPAYLNIDKRGRRVLLLSTVPFLALALIGAAFSYDPSQGTQSAARFRLIYAFTLVFALFYSPGLGPVPFTFSAEVFPLVNRGVGMSFAVFWNFLGAGILSLTLPKLTQSLDNTHMLLFFAGMNILVWILVFLFVPETKKATLEELNYIFQVGAWKHAEYQLTHVLPWFWNHYIRRTRPRPLEAPYRWLKVQQVTESVADGEAE